ncbi:hypothetical protein Slala02_57260 [Streptomyces lavendulae subsp. lavendulae]|nr:hypothetical protein [Streptomyces lavendulae]GLX22422.1 hypothetical protein Slala01_60660 [Streptomyces lavendulae subsp. lavendulae]GLX29906.1 hypothetical protein Slala02_57260 [Streptomyces lavendulae subsp. lavendulae]
MHGDVGTAPPLDRTDCLMALGDALQRWGADVPEDPGAGELAQLLDEVVKRLSGDGNTGQARLAVELLAQAAEALRAVARLGGLLPAVSMWHLRTAIRQEAAARAHLAEHRDLRPVASSR